MGRFVHFLTYKSKRVGKRTIGIDERNSTKECYICGAIHDMRLWNRIMDCDCGNVIDRDKNGAINIMKRYLSQNALGTGYQEFLGNLRQTAKRKTKVSHMGWEDSQEAPSVRVG
ncbi:MAG: zinc ribbon domain-containing protein [Promethearchaeota archaeon]